MGDILFVIVLCWPLIFGYLVIILGESNRKQKK